VDELATAVRQSLGSGGPLWRHGISPYSQRRNAVLAAVLKTLLTPANADIAIRTRVNRPHNIHGPERIDGLVININRSLAHVAWPNGETTVESVKHLVTIVA
jgi:hypothetical protein